jgi:predicted nucleotidyltransferase
MRTFAPLAERDLPVPGELLDALVDALGAPGRWVLIGATARDIALILGGVTLPRRATNDVDIAVAAHDAGDFDAMLATIGEPTRAWQRRRLLGQQVDVVPFGDLEDDGDVVIHESSLSVLGCAEAAANADLVTLPSGRLLPVAPLELIAVLKLIAFAGRQPAETKDADDLLTVLRAASEGMYGDETWDDELAMAATDYDHEFAGAHRLGRRGIVCFTTDRAGRVLEVATQIQPTVRLAWRGGHDELLEAWLAGLRTG